MTWALFTGFRYNILFMPMATVPMAMKALAEARHGVARLLELALVEGDAQASPAPVDSSLALRVTGGRFGWPSSEQRERRYDDLTISNMIFF